MPTSPARVPASRRRPRGGLLAGCGSDAGTADAPAAAESAAATPAPSASGSALGRGQGADSSSAGSAVAPGRYVELVDYDADPAAYAGQPVAVPSTPPGVRLLGDRRA
ncbi:MAG: hypothetical protein R2734_11030 [Nocardioides sp.]